MFFPREGHRSIGIGLHHTSGKHDIRPLLSFRSRSRVCVFCAIAASTPGRTQGLTKVSYARLEVRRRDRASYGEGKGYYEQEVSTFNRCGQWLGLVGNQGRQRRLRFGLGDITSLIDFSRTIRAEPAAGRVPALPARAIHDLRAEKSGITSCRATERENGSPRARRSPRAGVADRSARRSPGQSRHPWITTTSRWK